MPYGDRERYLAGKAQMKVFDSNQYLYWRVGAVKSIRKIIFDADNFYTPFYRLCCSGWILAISLIAH